MKKILFILGGVGLACVLALAGAVAATSMHPSPNFQVRLLPANQWTFSSGTMHACGPRTSSSWQITTFGPVEVQRRL